MQRNNQVLKLPRGYAVYLGVKMKYVANTPRSVQCGVPGNVGAFFSSRCLFFATTFPTQASFVALWRRQSVEQAAPDGHLHE